MRRNSLECRCSSRQRQRASSSWKHPRHARSVAFAHSPAKILMMMKVQPRLTDVAKDKHGFSTGQQSPEATCANFGAYCHLQMRIDGPINKSVHTALPLAHVCGTLSARPACRHHLCDLVNKIGCDTVDVEGRKNDQQGKRSSRHRQWGHQLEIILDISCGARLWGLTCETLNKDESPAAHAKGEATSAADHVRLTDVVNEKHSNSSVQEPPDLGACGFADPAHAGRCKRQRGGPINGSVFTLDWGQPWLCARNVHVDTATASFVPSGHADANEHNICPFVYCQCIPCMGVACRICCRQCNRHACTHRLTVMPSHGIGAQLMHVMVVLSHASVFCERIRKYKVRCWCRGFPPYHPSHHWTFF